MNPLVLAGCTPVPLADYLKALGVLRLVAEQADSGAAGWWQDGCFHLRTKLDRRALTRFFLESYRPTPIVAPWNGGSGFYRKGNTTAFNTLGAMRESQSRRLASYRQVISEIDGLLARLSLNAPPDKAGKAKLLRLLRSGAPESLLRWFNAAVVLSGGDPAYPPLLGTGGNDGRLDFTNNFMQRLLLLFDPATGEPGDRAPAWLDGALFAEPVSGLEKGAIGQFDPGAAGGPNATTGFEAPSLTNPWDFILMLEGALAFAAAVSRRLEAAGGGGLSFPFTVRATAAGAGTTAPEELANARAEIWLPLWQRPACWSELEQLFSEGRARVGRRLARDGLDFVRALASLGVDRGISAFQRYAFLMRSGKAYLATPLGRVAVRRNPEADLIADLERGGFLDRVRGWPRDDSLPASLRQAAWSLEQALFRQAERGGPRAVQDTLLALGGLARAMAHFHKKDAGGQDLRPPLPRLDAGWLLRADDGGDTFRLAAAIAGLGAGQSALPMAAHMLPVVREGNRWRWLEEAPDWVWREGGVVRGLETVVQRRLLLAGRDESWPAKPFGGRMGASAAVLMRWWLEAPAAVAHRRLDGLISGLALVEPVDLPSPGREADLLLPAAWWVLRAWFTPDAVLQRAGLLPAGVGLPAEPRLPMLLRAGRIDEAVTLGWRGLGAHGVRLPPAGAPALPVTDGPRLLASLVIPMTPGQLYRGLASLTPDIQPMEESA